MVLVNLFFVFAPALISELTSVKGLDGKSLELINHVISAEEHTVCTNLTGLICFNRTHVALCIGDANSSDNLIVSTGLSESVNFIYSCPQDSVCLGGRGCIKNDSLLTRKRPFRCKDVGCFPDPYNCQMYHECSVNSKAIDTFEDQEISCKETEIYSVYSGTCMEMPDKFKCSPDPICHTEMEVGALNGDNSIFYVCVTDASFPGDLSPDFYRCRNQHVFNPSVLACAPRSFNWGSLPLAVIL